MKIRPLSRRAVLRGAGVSLGLPLLSAMFGPTVSAQSAPKLPRRILFYYTANGFPPQHWRCDVAAEVTALADVKLSRILEPLAPVQDRCLFIEGVPLSSGYHPKQTAVAHAGGTSALLTGTYSPPGMMYGGFAEDKSGYPESESVDHAIAAQVGQQTRFPAYYMGVRVSSPTLLNCVFYAGKDQPITVNSDPYAVKDELFGPEFGAKLAADRDAAERARLEQVSVLDAVLENANALRCQLGGEDRARLDLHLTQVREIEKSLDARLSENPACTLAVPPPGLQVNQESMFPAIGRAQADLMAMALTCDLTRVGGFFFNPALSNPTYTWLGHSRGHHDLTHDTTQFEACADVNRWHAQELLYLVNKLAQTPEGDGSVLDNTVIVWASECAQSEVGDPHDLHNVGFTLIGSGQGHFQTGRYLRFPGGDAYSHNRLLLSLMHYMGVAAETFGEPEYCAGGPLPLLAS